jgi:multiple sugar transport system permease protein
MTRTLRLVRTNALWSLAVLAGLVFAATPFVWSVYVALTDRVASGDFWHFPNFTSAWSEAEFSKYTMTTFWYALVTAAGATMLSALGGYAFGRLRFRGRTSIFAFIIGTSMIPSAVTVLPLFLLMVRWPLEGGNNVLGQGGAGFYNTFSGLVLPGFTAVTSIFLARQFFIGLPRDLEDAARLDGAGEWRILLRIMIPLAKPGLATVFVLQFQDAWNAYLWPVVIATSQNLWTLQVGLVTYKRIATYDFGAVGALQAAAILSSLPIIILFLCAQRTFRRGLASLGEGT